MKKDVKDIVCKESDGKVVITVSSRMKAKTPDAGFDVVEVFVFNNEGQFSLNCDIKPYGKLVEVARIGYEMVMPKNLDRFDCMAKDLSMRILTERMGSHSDSTEEPWTSSS